MKTPHRIIYKGATYVIALSTHGYERAMERMDALEARGKDVEKGTLQRINATTDKQKLVGIFLACKKRQLKEAEKAVKDRWHTLNFGKMPSGMEEPGAGSKRKDLTPDQYHREHGECPDGYNWDGKKCKETEEGRKHHVEKSVQSPRSVKKDTSSPMHTHGCRIRYKGAIYIMANVDHEKFQASHLKLYQSGLKFLSRRKGPHSKLPDMPIDSPIEVRWARDTVSSGRAAGLDDAQVKHDLMNIGNMTADMADDLIKHARK